MNITGHNCIFFRLKIKPLRLRLFPHMVHFKLTHCIKSCKLRDVGKDYRQRRTGDKEILNIITLTHTRRWQDNTHEPLQRQTCDTCWSRWKKAHTLRHFISWSISSRRSRSRLGEGLNRGDAECYQTQRWFVLGTPRLSALVGHSERWQLGLAKVTAAFARGPAHFRSCLAKLCSTWWLVRSDKSTASSTSTRTNTPSVNSSGQADGVIVTASLL